MDNKLVAGIAVGALLLAWGPAGAAGNPEAGQQKAAACMACHGADGNSPPLPPPTEQWPKLAGQLPEDPLKQLHDCKAGRRTNEQMSPQAQAVNDADMADIAAFFASQKIGPNEAGNKDLLAQGENIFLKGKGRPNPVPACIGCHGPSGAGNRDWAKIMSKMPTVLAPAIGGQHASYIAKQLKSYKDGTRSNDVAHVMRDIAQRLDDKDIDAVAEYLAGLSR